MKTNYEKLVDDVLTCSKPYVKQALLIINSELPAKSKYGKLSSILYEYQIEEGIKNHYAKSK
jgi:hypothetical protein